MPAKARTTRKPKAVTESLDSASRKVGALGIFGISDFWRVPTILPRSFDLTNPVTEFSALRAGQNACVGGTPVNCTVTGTDRQDEDATEDVGEGDEHTADDEGEAAEDGEPETEPTSRREDDPANAAELPARRVCGFTLKAIHGSGRLRVELPLVTKWNEATANAAREGRGVWMYGAVESEGDGLVLRAIMEIAPADLNEVQAYYPSRTRKVLQPVKGKGGRRSRKPGKWIVRRMSATTTGVLVRDKNRYAIARCAVVLRDRLGLKSPQDEWELMQAVLSPAMTLAATLKLAHTPPNVEVGQAAAAALERLTAIEVLQQIIRERDSAAPKRRRVRTNAEQFANALEQLRKHGRIVASAEQRLAAAEILADLASEKKTERMLSGDVGTGKTIVFAIVAACVVSAGHLVVVLEPRSQLAEQIHARLKNFFPDIPMQLIAGASAETHAIERGIIVGTTGVWSRLEASGCSPALIIADEQQKFGVSQRCPWEHSEASIVEATATPIPRTQGLIEYGGIRVSTLRTCHVQKTITTAAVKAEDVSAMHHQVAGRVLKEGLNLILVFPLIERPPEADFADEEDGEGAEGQGRLALEEDTPLAIEEVVDTWEALVPGGVRVIHGRLPDDRRSDAIAAFESGACQVLIATSIVEVGIDFKRADMMVIHHPERFGVAAVHQLRGRLARQGGKGWCYLACGRRVSEEQFALLELMETEQDGFKLAVADMERRGFGDLRRHAQQQSGEYAGFLVDRPPTVQDINWADEHCGRWLGEGAARSDLLDDDSETLRAVQAIAAPRRKARALSPALQMAAEEGLQQASLFGE